MLKLPDTNTMRSAPEAQRILTTSTSSLSSSISSLVPLSGVIFDHDGVLVGGGHFMFLPEVICWIPGAASLIRVLDSRGV